MVGDRFGEVGAVGEGISRGWCPRKLSTDVVSIVENGGKKRIKGERKLRK